MADPDFGWQLPTVVTPEEFWCYQIYVPKDIAYLRALRGAIGELAYSWNWQRDSEHTASTVVQNWLEQIVDADVRFNESEGDCMTSCDDILECILTTAEIQEAIMQYSQQGSVTPTTPESSEILATELVNNPDGCDNDIIFGMTRQLVEFVDAINLDILEQLIAASAASKALAYLISAIPVVESLPLDEFVGLADWLTEVIYEAYDAASTVTLRNEVACDLFCLAQANDCILSMEDCRDYFYDKVGVTLDLSNPGSFLNDLIAENLIGVATFYGMYTFVFQLMVFGETILGTRWQTFVKIVQSFFNDPDPDWDTICDECPDIWSWDSDFTTEKDIWEWTTDAYGNNADWASSVGWTSVSKQVSAVPDYIRGTQLTTGFFTPTQITKVVLTYNYVRGDYVNDTTAMLAINLSKESGGVDTEIKTESEMIDGDGQTIEYTGSLLDIERIRVWCRSSQQSSAMYAGSAKIVSLHIEGTGFNPFE